MNNTPNYPNNGSNNELNGQQYNGQQQTNPQQQFNTQQQFNPQQQFNSQQQYYAQQPYNAQQQYNGQQYSPFPQRPKVPDGKAMSVTALVLGICSAFFSMILASAFPISLLFLACGIVGIVLAVLGRMKSMQCYGKPSGMATAGLVLSIIGTAISALFIVSCLACVACLGSELYYWF